MARELKAKTKSQCRSRCFRDLPEDAMEEFRPQLGQQTMRCASWPSVPQFGFPPAISIA